MEKISLNFTSSWTLSLKLVRFHEYPLILMWQHAFRPTISYARQSAPISHGRKQRWPSSPNELPEFSSWYFSLNPSIFLQFSALIHIIQSGALELDRFQNLLIPFSCKTRVGALFTGKGRYRFTKLTFSVESLANSVHLLYRAGLRAPLHR